jgi:hypothetical protein
LCEATDTIHVAQIAIVKAINTAMGALQARAELPVSFSSHLDSE